MLTMATAYFDRASRLRTTENMAISVRSSNYFPFGQQSVRVLFQKTFGQWRLPRGLLWASAYGLDTMVILFGKPYERGRQNFIGRAPCLSTRLDKVCSNLAPFKGEPKGGCLNERCFNHIKRGSWPSRVFNPTVVWCTCPVLQMMIRSAFFNRIETKWQSRDGRQCLGSASVNIGAPIFKKCPWVTRNRRHRVSRTDAFCFSSLEV